MNDFHARRAHALVFLLLLAACNGDDGGGANAGELPLAPEVALDAGPPLPVCSADDPCPTGSSCVLAVGDRGHCFADGEGGGRCRASDHDACDPGLACAGKASTCVPVVAVGEICAAAACAAGTTCGAIGDAIGSRCAAAGALGGVCRGESPRCDRGLGCATSTGRCAPLDGDGRCLVSGRELGCPDGQVCPRAPGGSSDAKCVDSGRAGGPCRAAGGAQPRCDDGVCYMGKCDASVSPVGSGCFGGEFHSRCEDGSSCVDEVCVPLGVEGGQCRAMGIGGVPPACDAPLACYMMTCRPTLPEGSPCDPAKPETSFCVAGTTCVTVALDDARCLRDGGDGGVCRFRAAPVCDPPLRCTAQRVGPRRCFPPLPLGSPCSRAREASQPCEAGAGCGYGREVCVGDGTLGGRCRTGGACDDGLVCAADGISRSCIPAPPVVAIGAPCDARADEPRRTDRCAEGSLCVATPPATTGVCVADGGAGAPCRVGSDLGACDAGLSCQLAKCVPGLAVGAECLEGTADCGAPAICVRVEDSEESAKCRLVPGFDVVPAAGLEVPDGCAGDGTPVRFRGTVDGAHPRDEGDARVPLPFTFPFFGKSTHEVAVSPNGVIGFPSPNDLFSPGGGGNGAIPTDGAPAIVAPFWDDLVLGAPGSSEVCTRVLGVGDAGAGPGARFVVEWKRVGRVGRRTVELGFALALRPDGSIDVAYRHLGARTPEDAAFASGARAAIGAQSASGRRAVVWHGAVPAERALRFVPKP